LSQTVNRSGNESDIIVVLRFKRIEDFSVFKEEFSKFITKEIRDLEVRSGLE